MNKTIIVLQGKSNSGKSQTIFLLYKKLKKNTKYEIIKDLSRPTKKDFNYVIFKMNKILIGITTYGDYPGQYKKFLQILIKEKCKILLCACHNTVNSLKAFIKLKEFEKANIFFIPKNITKKRIKTEILKYNEYDSKLLLNKLSEILN
jgi:hypothetical protein